MLIKIACTDIIISEKNSMSTSYAQKISVWQETCIRKIMKLSRISVPEFRTKVSISIIALNDDHIIDNTTTG